MRLVVKLLIGGMIATTPDDMIPRQIQPTDRLISLSQAY